MCQDDYNKLKMMFRGRAMGIQNRDNFTDEDMEAWKHVYSQPGVVVLKIWILELASLNPMPDS